MNRHNLISTLMVLTGIGLAAAISCPLFPKKNSTVTESSDRTFKTDVMSSKKPVIVDFYATWCGACKKMSPIMEGIASEYGDQIVVVKVDIDKNPILSNKYNIQSLPALKLFRNGEVVGDSVGYLPISELRLKISNELAHK